jgi:hypothetical protein
MEIRFQPALLQEVIDSFIEKTEREGDPTYYKEFHEYADPIYEKFALGPGGLPTSSVTRLTSIPCSRKKWGSCWSKGF